MKKILIFVLAAVLSLAMLFSVTACGDSEVVDPVTVTISQETASVEVGSTITLTATTSDSSTVKWSTSDRTVANVNATTGLVKGLKAGTATITATSGDATATCTVTVVEAGGGDPTGEPLQAPTIAIEGKELTITDTNTEGGFLLYGQYYR